MRWVLVKLPSYSAIWVDGKKKISVLMSAIFTSPFFTSGPRYQCVAVSVSQLSFTTSQSSCRSATRVAPPLSEVAGFWPPQHIPLTGPADVAEQQLEQRAAADHLHGVGVLGPGHRVGERAGAVAARVLEQ